MKYKRIPFNQYFIDVSKDYKKTGKARYDIKFNHEEFTFKLFNLFPIKCSSEWEVHYEEDRNVIQVNFEETEGKTDWLINFIFKEKMYDKFNWNGKKIQLKACKGWSKMYMAMRKNVKESIKALLKEHPDAFIEVVGWSLGSGQAQMACQDIYYNFNKKPYLYTFGTVKPWRGFKTVRDYLNSTYEECYCFRHRSDIISYLPPFIGFFSMKLTKLGKFNFFHLFNPLEWHTLYGEEYLYEGI